MKIAALLFFCLVGFLITKAESDNCSVEFSSWKTEKEAISSIENLDFQFSETIENDTTSWLKSASFYSCDGKHGYLVVRGNQKEYIHTAVPVEVWKDLKNARSKGGFYNFYIKDKFTFKR